MSSFPWARTGLIVGLSFAVVGAFFISRDASTKDASPEAVTMVPGAPVGAAPVASVAPALVPANAPLTPLAPADVPWPPGARRSRSASSWTGGGMETGDSPLRNDAAEKFFADALDSCGPKRWSVGESVALVCENAREELRAMIMPRPQPGGDDGTWLRTSRARYEAPTASAPVVDAASSVARASCGWTLGYVALPPGARVSSTSGGDNRGHCSFDVDGDPERTFATMVENLFRGKTTVHKREMSGDGIVRRSAEGWDEGWWSVDVVNGAGVAASRVTLARWSPVDGRWMAPSPPGDERRIVDDVLSAAFECAESCDAAKDAPRDKEALARCLFACEHKRGHPPGVIEQMR